MGFWVPSQQNQGRYFNAVIVAKIQIKNIIKFIDKFPYEMMSQVKQAGLPLDTNKDVEKSSTESDAIEDHKNWWEEVGEIFG